MRKYPSLFNSFFVESHQRFHSASLKISPSINWLICVTVAEPPRLSRTLRMTPAGSFLTSSLIAFRSLAFFARKMFRRDDGQIISRVSQLHRMRFLSREIDQDLIEEKIPLRDAAESPALVQAEGAWGEFFEMIGR